MYVCTSVLPSISIDESFCCINVQLPLTKFWLSFVDSAFSCSNVRLQLPKVWISFVTPTSCRRRAPRKPGKPRKIPPRIIRQGRLGEAQGNPAEARGAEQIQETLGRLKELWKAWGRREVA